MGFLFTEHQYSCASIGLKKNINKRFASRQEAKEFMYKILLKNNIDIIEVWHDNHDVTYVCGNGVNFYIQRAI